MYPFPGVTSVRVALGGLGNRRAPPNLRYPARRSQTLLRTIGSHIHSPTPARAPAPGPGPRGPPPPPGFVQDARVLDFADRFLNCAAVKHMFAAGHTERGERCAGLFTKEGNGLNNLFTMQATWYERSAARAHFARGEYNRGLKKVMSVFKHFTDFVEDQYDFHMYCMRKLTLVPYCDMLKMMDGIYKHESFVDAAVLACDALLHVAGDPALRRSPEEVEEALLAGMSKAERKDYKRRKEEEAEARRRKQSDKEKPQPASWGPRDKPDDDPDGQRWLSTHDPLEEASALVEKLRKFAEDRPEAHVTAFEVYLARGKVLLALQALKGLQKADAAAPPIVAMGARLAAAARGDGLEGGAAVAAVLQRGLESVVGADAGAWVAQWAEAHGTASLEHAAALAHARIALGGDRASALAGVLDARWPRDARDTDEPRFREVHRRLAKASSGIHDESAADAFFRACTVRFPRSAYFGGAAATPAPGGVPEVLGPAEGSWVAVPIQE